MNRLEQANSKSLKELLAKNGYTPAPKSTHSKLWYKSPLRAENAPSFCIRTSDGKWKDYGNGGGLYQSNIDFVKLYYKVSVNEAIDILLDGEISLRTYEPVPEDTRPYFKIVESLEINPGSHTEGYVLSRKIDANLARKYCVKLRVRYPKANNPKRVYSLVGFKNMSGGYEVRMEFPFANFKSTLTPNNITKIVGSERELVFEGFFNFLSYVTLYGDTDKTVYVLNGTGNWVYLKELKDAEYWGDNGRHWNHENKYVSPGDILLENLRQKGKIRDMRYIYAPYEDLNDYLCDEGKMLHKSGTISKIIG